MAELEPAENLELLHTSNYIYQAKARAANNAANSLFFVSPFVLSFVTKAKAANSAANSLFFVLPFDECFPYHITLKSSILLYG
jgi:hypothetical protein